MNISNQVFNQSYCNKDIHLELSINYFWSNIPCKNGQKHMKRL